jgi:hypothetical protein
VNLQGYPAAVSLPRPASPRPSQVRCAFTQIQPSPVPTYSSADSLENALDVRRSRCPPSIATPSWFPIAAGSSSLSEVPPRDATLVITEVVVANVAARSRERLTFDASRFARCGSGGARSAHHRERLQCARPHPTSYGDGSCTPRPACAARPEPRARSSQARAAPVRRGPGTQSCRYFEALSCDASSNSNPNATRKEAGFTQERRRGHVNVS